MTGERRGNLSEVAADYLRDKIMTGQLKMRERIVEKDIAEQLGMSRGPIREALTQLQHEGFVDYEPNKGCTVTLLSPKDAYEVFFLRGSLEKLALERCGGHLLRDSTLIMEEALKDMQGCDDQVDCGRGVALDELFHRQILLSGQMDRLTKIWDSLSPLNGAMFLTVRNMHDYERRIKRVDNEEAYSEGRLYEIHNKLFQVLIKGNLEESKKAIDQHYLSTGEWIFRVGMKLKNLGVIQGINEF